MHAPVKITLFLNFSSFILDKLGEDYLKESDGDLKIPGKYLTDKLAAIFLTGVFYTNTKTRSNVKSAYATILRDATFAGLSGPKDAEGKTKWPEVYKTMMGIHNDPNFKGYRATKSEIVGDSDDYNILNELTSNRSKIP